MKLFKRIKQRVLALKTKLFDFIISRKPPEKKREINPKVKAALVEKEKEAILDLFDIYMLSDKLTDKERKHIKEWKDFFPKNIEQREKDLKFFDELDKIKYEAEAVRGIINKKQFITERQISKFSIEELNDYIQTLQKIKTEKEKIIKENKWSIMRNKISELNKIFSK